ncbi:MAG TPA: twin-arginine translocase TatA/TatE family subunit [Nitrolancea sp.]|nr:twin-arginine translocase TatA/TatE family subunit [Nitrolancea sp.]
MAGLGWQELVLILLIVVIIFGAGKLPEIGGAVGRGIKDFRTATTTDETGSDAGLGNTSAHETVDKDAS